MCPNLILVLFFGLGFFLVVIVVVLVLVVLVFFVCADFADATSILSDFFLSLFIHYLPLRS